MDYVHFVGTFSLAEASLASMTARARIICMHIPLWVQLVIVDFPVYSKMAPERQKSQQRIKRKGGKKRK